MCLLLIRVVGSDFRQRLSQRGLFLVGVGEDDLVDMGSEVEVEFLEELEGVFVEGGEEVERGGHVHLLLVGLDGRDQFGHVSSVGVVGVLHHLHAVLE